MKRTYSAIIAILATGAFAVAAQPTAQPAQSSQPLTHQQELQKPSGAIMLQRGFIKQGDKIFRVDQVTKATRLEGLEVDPQGHIMKDGKRIELKDGQLVTPEGQVENFEHGR